MDNASLNAMHQDRHEADAYRRIELITGTVRRRRWTNEEKAAIVAESTRPGVNVSDVARRFGVNRGLLQTWRRKAIGERPFFVPLRVQGLVGAADNNKDRTNIPRSVAVETEASIIKTHMGTLGNTREFVPLVLAGCINPQRDEPDPTPGTATATPGSWRWR